MELSGEHSDRRVCLRKRLFLAFELLGRALRKMQQTDAVAQRRSKASYRPVELAGDGAPTLGSTANNPSGSN